MASPHCGDGRRVLALDVRHAETAADRQLGELVRLHEVGHDLERQLEEPRFEHLAADVGVHPDQLEGRRRPRPLDGTRRRARRDREAELGVVLAGAHELVGVRLDAGCDAHEHGGPRHAIGQAFEAIELVERVDDDATRRHRRARRAARRPTCCCRATPAASAGTPAARATWYSPPVDTSRFIPSS